MAHYAFLDENNIVTEVIVGVDESDTSDLPEGFADWEEWYTDFRGQTCKRTSYNTNGNVHDNNGTPYRGNFAGKGFIYDQENDVFYPPAPFPSWTLNANWVWEAPVVYPTITEPGTTYEWNEETQSWDLVEQIMSDTNEFGYIGASPTQSSSANTGVFDVNDVTDLLADNQWSLQDFPVQYLVVAGGGGASTASSSANRPGGGAGAGGYRNSYASETSGGNSTTESTHSTILGTSYTVTVGGGGSGGSGNYLRSGTKGADSVFSTITSEGGGAVLVNDGADEDGGSGGGGMHNNGAGGDGIAGQGHDGGDTNNATSQTGGGGGGAGSAGGNNVHFQSGTSNNGAGLASSITGSSVTRAVGGSAGQQGTTSGVNASANTGSGGGGSSSNGSSGNGGSGVVILRYSNLYTITVGSGLTHGSEQTDGDDKYIVFTAGTDTVSFSA